MSGERIRIEPERVRANGHAVPDPEGGAPPPELIATERARVLIGIEKLGFHQEVLDYLGRSRRLQMVRSTGDPLGIDDALDEVAPDAAVVSPAFARAIAHRSDRGAVSLFVVAEEMTVPVLRAAIDAGAQGAFCWPEERADLAGAIPRVHAARPASRLRGRVVAVIGARGGVGVTFLASHLAAAMTDAGLSVALVDMDPTFADLTAALGIDGEVDARSIVDLVPVIEELSPEHVEHVLTRHPRGFGVLLGRAPERSDQSAASERDEPQHGSAPVGSNLAVDVPSGLYAASVALLAGSFDAVVLHVPRTLGPIANVAAELADRVVLVTGLDLMSLYGGRRVVSALGLGTERRPLTVVVNATRGAEVTPSDVERVLGVAPALRVRTDPKVVRSQDRARILDRRSSRAMRDVSRLASLLMAPTSEEA